MATRGLLSANFLNGCRRADPAGGAQPVGPFARHDGGSNASPEVGIKLSSDRGHFLAVIRKAGTNGPLGLGKAGRDPFQLWGISRHSQSQVRPPHLPGQGYVCTPGPRSGFFVSRARSLLLDIDHVEGDGLAARRLLSDFLRRSSAPRERHCEARPCGATDCGRSKTRA